MESEAAVAFSGGVQFLFPLSKPDAAQAIVQEIHASRDRATGGAGLGLAIVRRLAEAQNGTVIARSVLKG